MNYQAVPNNADYDFHESYPHATKRRGIELVDWLFRC